MDSEAEVFTGGEDDRMGLTSVQLDLVAFVLQGEFTRLLVGTGITEGLSGMVACGEICQSNKLGRDFFPSLQIVPHCAWKDEYHPI